VSHFKFAIALTVAAQIRNCYEFFPSQTLSEGYLKVAEIYEAVVQTDPR
jgi:hypothetical protein